MKYLLPCECGESVRIEVSQAGRSVACVCGKSLDVPAMRAIRELDPDAQSDAKPVVRRWNAAHGAVFAVGSVLLVVALGFAVYSHLQYSFGRSAIPDLPDAQTVSVWVDEVDDWSAADAWAFWSEFRSHDVPEVSGYAVLKRRLEQSRLRTIGLYSVAGVGLILAVGAMVLGAGRKR